MSSTHLTAPPEGLPEIRKPTAREWSSRALSQGLVQPDARSCGAAVLVFSRMLHDTSYAELVATGKHPITHWEIPGDTQHDSRVKIWACTGAQRDRHG